MKEYTVADKETSIILGILVMTPVQARKAEKDFIIKENFIYTIHIVSFP